MALGIVSMLLLGVAMLALAAYAAAIAALAMAGLEQHAARALQAAEAGVARTLRTWPAPGAGARALPEQAWPEAWPDVTLVRDVSADPPDWPGPLPDGFSIGSGDGTFTSRHYTITSEARGGRRTAARLEQGFMVVAPAP